MPLRFPNPFAKRRGTTADVIDVVAVPVATAGATAPAADSSAHAREACPAAEAPRTAFLVTRLAHDFGNLPDEDRLDLSSKRGWWIVPLAAWVSLVAIVANTVYFRLEESKVDASIARVSRQISSVNAQVSSLQGQNELNGQVFSAAADIIAWKRSTPPLQPLIIDLLTTLSAQEGNRLTTLSVHKEPSDTKYNLSFVLSGDPRFFSDTAKRVTETLKRHGWVSTVNPKRMDTSNGSSLDYATIFWRPEDMETASK